MAPPLSVIKIVKYCDVWGGGHCGGGGRQNPTKNIASPFSVSKIVKYCGVRGGGGGIAGRQNPAKDNGVPSFCQIVGKNILHINNIIVYCLSLLPSVLFEKLTATVVCYFTSTCHI